jgi:hypothetical protein
VPQQPRVGRQAPPGSHHAGQSGGSPDHDRVGPGGGADQRHLLSTQYRPIARRRGPNKAAVAVAHSLLDVIWHMLPTGEVFADLGADCFTSRHDKEHQARRVVSQLEKLSFTVQLTAAG